MQSRVASRGEMSGPGGRMIVLGVVLLVLSVGTLVWSNASEWIHRAQEPAAPPTETLPAHFNLVTPAAVRPTRRSRDTRRTAILSHARCWPGWLAWVAASPALSPGLALARVAPDPDDSDRRRTPGSLTACASYGPLRLDAHPAYRRRRRHGRRGRHRRLLRCALVRHRPPCRFGEPRASRATASSTGTC